MGLHARRTGADRRPAVSQSKKLSWQPGPHRGKQIPRTRFGASYGQGARGHPRGSGGGTQLPPIWSRVPRNFGAPVSTDRVLSLLLCWTGLSRKLDVCCIPATLVGDCRLVGGRGPCLSCDGNTTVGLSR